MRVLSVCGLVSVYECCLFVFVCVCLHVRCSVFLFFVCVWCLSVVVCVDDRVFFYL